MFSVLRDLLRYNVEFAFGAVLTGIVVDLRVPQLLLARRPDVDLQRDPGPAAVLAILVRHELARPGDVLAALSFAFRNTLSFGITVALLSRVISIVVGLAAGYLGGWVDRVLMFAQRHLRRDPDFPDPDPVLLRDAGLT